MKLFICVLMLALMAPVASPQQTQPANKYSNNYPFKVTASSDLNVASTSMVLELMHLDADRNCVYILDLVVDYKDVAHEDCDGKWVFADGWNIQRTVQVIKFIEFR